MTSAEYLEAHMDKFRRHEVGEYLRALIAQATTYSHSGDGPFDPAGFSTDPAALGRIVVEAQDRLAGIYFDENDNQIQVVLDDGVFPSDKFFFDDDANIEADDESK